MTSREVDSGQRIEDSPPTLRLRRIIVAGDVSRQNVVAKLALLNKMIWRRDDK